MRAVKRHPLPMTLAISIGLGLAPSAVLPAGPAHASTAAAAADETTCFGQSATITRTDGSNVVGTAGDDVIVSHNSQYVDAGAGDDLICASADYGYEVYLARVKAGPGDDRVRVDAEYSNTLLGSGADEFVGGPGDDDVSADASGESSRDVIRTGDGNDSVRSGYYQGTYESPVEGPIPVNEDVIETGAGGDWLQLLRSAPTTADLGGGWNRMDLIVDSDQAADLDLAEQRAVIDGRSGTLRGVVAIAPGDTWKQLRITGSHRAERLDLDVRTRSVMTSTEVDLAGGADRVVLFSNSQNLPRDLRIRLGGGSDALVFSASTGVPGTSAPHGSTCGRDGSRSPGGASPCSAPRAPGSAGPTAPSSSAMARTTTSRPTPVGRGSRAARATTCCAPAKSWPEDVRRLRRW